MITYTTWFPRSFLGRLPTNERGVLLKMGELVELRPGSVLMRAGEPDDRVYVLLAGMVNVTVDAANGVRSLLAIRHSGDLVGEMAAISSDPRSATVTARGRVEARVLSAGEFIKFLAEYPQAALAANAITGDRLAQTTSYRTDTAAYSVEIRLARALLYQGQRMRQREGGRYCVTLTQLELAELIGAKEGTVQKALTRSGELSTLVQVRRGRVILLDIRGLENLAGLTPPPATGRPRQPPLAGAGESG